MKIDLRSDTVTKPTPAMLEAMMTAEVGDDIFEEDPTINALEEKAANMFGKEAGIFCPSGTMTNQIAIKLHTRPGDQVIIERNSHVYYYEGGGIAINSGASVKLLDGDRGRITSNQILESINPDDIHFPVSKVVSVQNTTNRGGGCCYNWNQLEAINETCKENDLTLHLDGARLFNALIKTGTNAAEIGPLFNTISICLSKGLGAPVGSILLGTKANIKQARRIRKVFGGGMRQAGYLAAAGIYALDNHIERLNQDHDKAQVLANELNAHDFIAEVLPVETNIVYFKLHERYSGSDFVGHLSEHNILALSLDKQTVRLVTHLDFSDEMLEKVINAIKAFNN